MVTFLWNLAIVCYCALHVHSMTRFYFKVELENKQINSALNKKPFFSIIYLFSFLYQFQFYCSLTILYYICITVNSDRLVKLLDAFQFKTSFFSKSNVIAFVLAHFFFFLITIWPLLAYIWSTGNYTQLVLNFVVFFTFNLHSNTTFFLLHYTQYCTFQELAQLNANSNFTVNQIKNRLSHLAKVNRQLHQLFSFPLCLSIIPYVTELIVTLSVIYVKNFSEINTYFFQMLFNLFTSVALNEAVQRKLKLISKLTSSESSFANKNSTALIREETVFIYRSYFHLKIFHICEIDWKWLASLAFFITNYVVLVTQTNKLN